MRFSHHCRRRLHALFGGDAPFDVSNDSDQESSSGSSSNDGYDTDDPDTSDSATVIAPTNQRAIATCGCINARNTGRNSVATSRKTASSTDNDTSSSSSEEEEEEASNRCRFTKNRRNMSHYPKQTRSHNTMSNTGGGTTHLISKHTPIVDSSSSSTITPSFTAMRTARVSDHNGPLSTERMALIAHPCSHRSHYRSYRPNVAAVTTTTTAHMIPSHKLSLTTGAEASTTNRHQSPVSTTVAISPHSRADNDASSREPTMVASSSPCVSAIITTCPESATLSQQPLRIDCSSSLPHRPPTTITEPGDGGSGGRLHVATSPAIHHGNNSSSKETRYDALTIQSVNHHHYPSSLLSPSSLPPISPPSIATTSPSLHDENFFDTKKPRSNDTYETIHTVLLPSVHIPLPPIHSDHHQHDDHTPLPIHTSSHDASLSTTPPPLPLSLPPKTPLPCSPLHHPFIEQIVYCEHVKHPSSTVDHSPSHICSPNGTTTTLLFSDMMNDNHHHHPHVSSTPFPHHPIPNHIKNTHSSPPSGTIIHHHQANAAEIAATHVSASSSSLPVSLSNPTTLDHDNVPQNCSNVSTTTCLSKNSNESTMQSKIESPHRQTTPSDCSIGNTVTSSHPSALQTTTTTSPVDTVHSTLSIAKIAEYPASIMSTTTSTSRQQQQPTQSNKIQQSSLPKPPVHSVPMNNAIHKADNSTVSPSVTSNHHTTTDTDITGVPSHDKETVKPSASVLASNIPCPSSSSSRHVVDCHARVLCNMPQCDDPMNHDGAHNHHGTVTTSGTSMLAAPPSSSTPIKFANLTLQEICINCITVSRLRAQEKMSISGENLFQIDNSMFPSISRWISGDDRTRIIQFIQHNMEQAMIHVCQIFQEIQSGKATRIQIEEFIEQLLRVCCCLDSMVHGFKAMKQTYETDAKILSNIDYLDKLRTTYVQRIIKQCTECIMQGISTSTTSIVTTTSQ